VRHHKVAVLNGPNLGRLGRREAEHYPETTLAALDDYCRERGAALGLDVECVQTDGEGELVGLIHRWGDAADGLLLNAAGYTHTSVAVRDAVLCCGAPVVEVHLSHPDAREEFRRRNLLRDVVVASVSGFGVTGYGLALEGLAVLLKARTP
jgi:3-dehydroquinate dehydratase-2